MLRRLAGLGLVVLLVASLTVGIQSSATAGQKCLKKGKNGICLVWITVPSPTPNPPVGHTNPPPKSGGGEGGTTTCTRGGKTIPCESGTGTWSQSNQCYAQIASPQPAAGSPLWQGKNPAKGSLYTCDFGFGTPTYIFIPKGNAPTINPATLAQQIAARLDIRAINIGIVPKPGPRSVGLVGMPTWMWVNQPGAATWGPITDSASAGGITVTVTANVDKVEWDMGDGTPTVICGKGTPYQVAFGKQDSPTCGHRYQHTSGNQPNNEYTVTANSYWTVNWSGGGQSGTIAMPALTQSTNIKVGEMQVLIQ